MSSSDLFANLSLEDKLAVIKAASQTLKSATDHPGFDNLILTTTKTTELFERIYTLLVEVDKRVNNIRPFSPTWKSFTDTFRDLLSSCQDDATSLTLHLEQFSTGILPYFLSVKNGGNLTPEDEKNLKSVIATLNKFTQRVQSDGNKAESYMNSVKFLKLDIDNFSEDINREAQSIPQIDALDAQIASNKVHFSNLQSKFSGVAILNELLMIARHSSAIKPACHDALVAGINAVPGPEVGWTGLEKEYADLLNKISEELAERERLEDDLSLITKVKYSIQRLGNDLETISTGLMSFGETAGVLESDASSLRNYAQSILNADGKSVSTPFIVEAASTGLDLFYQPIADALQKFAENLATSSA